MRRPRPDRTRPAAPPLPIATPPPVTERDRDRTGQVGQKDSDAGPDGGVPGSRRVRRLPRPGRLVTEGAHVRGRAAALLALALGVGVALPVEARGARREAVPAAADVAAELAAAPPPAPRSRSELSDLPATRLARDVQAHARPSSAQDDLTDWGGRAHLLRGALDLPERDRADRDPRPARPVPGDLERVARTSSARSVPRRRSTRSAARSRTSSRPRAAPARCSGSASVGAIWSASGYVGAFFRAANVVYEKREGRPFWKLRPLQILVTIVMTLLLALVAIAIVLTGSLAHAVGDAVGLGSQAVTDLELGEVARPPGRRGGHDRRRSTTRRPT